MDCSKFLRSFAFGYTEDISSLKLTIAWLLDQPPNDLLNVMVTRWPSHIRLFDFDIKHIRDEKNGAADGRSRRGVAEADNDEEDDSDAFFRQYAIRLRWIL